MECLGLRSCYQQFEHILITILMMAHILHDVYLKEKIAFRFGLVRPSPSFRPFIFFYKPCSFETFFQYRLPHLGVPNRQKIAIGPLCCLAWDESCARTSMLFQSIYKLVKNALTKSGGVKSISLTPFSFEYSFEGFTSPYRLKRSGVLYAF